MIQNEAPVAIRAEGWAIPAPGVTLEQLESELRLLGNDVLEVDTDNQRIKILDKTEAL